MKTSNVLQLCSGGYFQPACAPSTRLDWLTEPRNAGAVFMCDIDGVPALFTVWTPAVRKYGIETADWTAHAVSNVGYRFGL